MADVLAQAIAGNCTLINATAQRWPDRPIQVEFHWMPQMGKLDIVVRTVDHLPSWRHMKVLRDDDAKVVKADDDATLPESG